MRREVFRKEAPSSRQVPRSSTCWCSKSTGSRTCPEPCTSIYAGSPSRRATGSTPPGRSSSTATAVGGDECCRSCSMTRPKPGAPVALAAPVVPVQERSSEHAAPPLPLTGRAHLLSSAVHSQRVAQPLDLLRFDAVVGPASPLLTAQQARFVQHLEMVADCGLGQPEGPGELRLAHLAAGVIGDQAEDPETSRVGERTQRLRQLLGLLLIERREEQRRAAFGSPPDGPDVGHPHILTQIDIPANISIAIDINGGRYCIKEALADEFK